MKGWVYVISTKTHGLLKIGFTERDPKTRAKELDDTSSPHPHVVEYAALVENARGLEKLVHDKLHPFRVNTSREFFDCTVVDSIRAIKEVAGNSFLYEEDPFQARLKIEEEERLRREREAYEQEQEQIRLEEEQIKHDEMIAQFRERVGPLYQSKTRVNQKYESRIQTVRSRKKSFRESIHTFLYIQLIFSIISGGVAFLVFPGNRAMVNYALVFAFAVSAVLFVLMASGEGLEEIEKLKGERDKKIAEINVQIEHLRDSLLPPPPPPSPPSPVIEESQSTSEKKSGCGYFLFVTIILFVFLNLVAGCIT